MNNEENKFDIGFIITKSPLESTLGLGFLELAEKAVDSGKKIGVFFISDGIWFGKKNQKNQTVQQLQNLIKKNTTLLVSNDHLEAAGIHQSEIYDGVTVSEKPYMDLVDFVMEKSRRVITI